MGPGKVIAGSLTVPMPPVAAPSRIARVLTALGRTLIVCGALVLAFVGYQLWGTGLQERQAQRSLLEQFTTVVDPVTGTASAPSEGAPPVFEPAPGDPVARIRIPAIGVDKIVVWGTDLRDLRDGPGLYEGTPLPGQPGNSAIAGHRTTYGAPFARLDELAPGDLIEVDTAYGSARYRGAGTEIVTPDRIDVVEDNGDDRLTLTTCHPRFSDRERLIVWA
ncbi:MAG: class E sortase, partial [Actinobacteria bacterium]|nr:class E sortase [Actinomycetota bacterium]